MLTDQPLPSVKEHKSAYNRAWYAAGGDEMRAQKLAYNRAWRKARSSSDKTADRLKHNASARAAWASRSEEQKAARSARVRARYAAKGYRKPKSYRSIGSEYREALMHAMAERDGWNCWVCRVRVTLQTGSVDHVVSPLDGGTHTLGNMKIACKPCNTRRGRNAR